jgi:hypothetical protein
VIFLNPFTICSSCKWKFVVCLSVDKETNGNYPSSNRLNELKGLNELNGLTELDGLYKLNRLNGLAHLWLQLQLRSSSNLQYNGINNESAPKPLRKRYPSISPLPGHPSPQHTFFVCWHTSGPLLAPLTFPDMTGQAPFCAQKRRRLFHEILSEFFNRCLCQKMKK